MKNVLALFTVFLLSLTAYAQSPGDEYALKGDINLQRFNTYTLHIIVDTTTIYQAHRGNVFVIHSAQSVGGVSGFIIVFWKFKNSLTQHNGAGGIAYHNIDSSDNGISYFIPDSSLKIMATNDFRKPHGTLKIDALVLPIKIRFNNKQPGGEFDFLQSISVGPAVSFNTNYGGPFGKTSTSIILGFNVTNISADEKTVPGVLDSKSTLLGLSPVLGFSVDYQGINFGVLTGIDILTGSAGKAWAYRKSPWLGVSIGASLFSTSKEKQ